MKKQLHLLFAVSLLLLGSCRGHYNFLTQEIRSVKIMRVGDLEGNLYDSIELKDPKEIEHLVHELNNNHKEEWEFYPLYLIVLQYRDSPIYVPVNHNGIKIDGASYKTESNLNTILSKEIELNLHPGNNQ